jgi:hypothetical protein
MRRSRVKEPQSPELARFEALIGDWEIEATHPAVPGTVVRGTAHFEWLEGERFIVYRSRNDHPDFPDGISIIGITDGRLTMHYFDSRGVFRVYEASLTDGVLRIWRDAPGFSQRFEGPISDDGTVIDGLWELSEDDSTWNDDLKITYRRVS